MMPKLELAITQTRFAMFLLAYLCIVFVSLIMLVCFCISEALYSQYYFITLCSVGLLGWVSSIAFFRLYKLILNAFDIYTELKRLYKIGY